MTSLHARSPGGRRLAAAPASAMAGAHGLYADRPLHHGRRRQRRMPNHDRGPQPGPRRRCQPGRPQPLHGLTPRRRRAHLHACRERRSHAGGLRANSAAAGCTTTPPSTVRRAWRSARTARSSTRHGGLRLDRRVQPRRRRSAHARRAASRSLRPPAARPRLDGLPRRHRDQRGRDLGLRGLAEQRRDLRFNRAAGGGLTPAGCVMDSGAAAGCAASTEGLTGSRRAGGRPERDNGARCCPQRRGRHDLHPCRGRCAHAGRLLPGPEQFRILRAGDRGPRWSRHDRDQPRRRRTCMPAQDRARSSPLRAIADRGLVEDGLHRLVTSSIAPAECTVLYKWIEAPRAIVVSPTVSR